MFGRPNLYTSYEQETQMLPTWTQKAAMSTFVVVLFLMPFDLPIISQIPMIRFLGDDRQAGVRAGALDGTGGAVTGDAAAEDDDISLHGAPAAELAPAASALASRPRFSRRSATSGRSSFTSVSFLMNPSLSQPRRP